jgi:hypothetical protein
VIAPVPVQPLYGVPTFHQWCKQCTCYHASYDKNYLRARQWVEQMIREHNAPVPGDPTTEDTQEFMRPDFTNTNTEAKGVGQ